MNFEKLILEETDNLKDKIVEFHKSLICIPSENPPSKYNEISNFIAKKTREIGLETKLKRNNVIAETSSKNGLKIILNAHMDTVEIFNRWNKDPFGAELIENKIYGRGSSDDKSCITAQIFAIKALLNQNIDLKGKIILTTVVDEELGGLKGTKYLLENNLVNGDICLLGDSFIDYPVAYFGGALYARIIISGKQSHYCLPDIIKPYRNEYSGINAIHRMIEVMDFLMALQEEFNNIITNYPTPHDHPCKISFVNISHMNGGKKISIVPDKCFLLFSIVTIPEIDIIKIKMRIINYITKLQSENPNISFELNFPLFYYPKIMDVKSKNAKAIENAFKTVFKQDRGFKFLSYTHDAHWFYEKGIETFLLGASRVDNNIHTHDEFIYVEDLINAVKLFALSIYNLLK